ncbi:hypothetical protein ACHAXT_010212 [Thalassiosira profunda]
MKVAGQLSNRYYASALVGRLQAAAIPPSIDANSTAAADIDVSAINEGQVLLACRAYLLRKHKVEWKAKKRRAEAAASPLNNEGYFWHDPNDLLYLREDPDPYNLEYNETYAEYYGFKRNSVRFLPSRDTTYSGKNYLEDETDEIAEVERASTSSNPFSTNPLYPSEEHLRRSKAKLKLWNNRTWKEEWYEKRWGGKVSTQGQKVREKQDKMVSHIPNSILESPSFDKLSQDEVAEAIVTYLAANLRKSESRKTQKITKLRRREAFRQWREGVKEKARKSRTRIERSNTTEDVAWDIAQEMEPTPKTDDIALSFNPSPEAMRELRELRAEKSRQAYQQRLANGNATASSITQKITKLRRGYIEVDADLSANEEEAGEVSPMQAILHVDMALDHNKLPSATDVEIILKPGRLGRRRATLRRILSECFYLRGKCVPALTAVDELKFATKCTIEELGVFVLSKLRDTN